MINLTSVVNNRLDNNLINDFLLSLFQESKNPSYSHLFLKEAGIFKFATPNPVIGIPKIDNLSELYRADFLRDLRVELLEGTFNIFVSLYSVRIGLIGDESEYLCRLHIKMNRDLFFVLLNGFIYKQTFKR